MGLSCLFINNTYERTQTNYMGVITRRYQDSENYTKSSMDVGFRLEYELKDVIAHKFSLSFTLHPDVAIYFIQSASVWLYGGIGFKYSLGKSEK